MGPRDMNERRDPEVPDAEAAGPGPGAVPVVETWEGRDDVIVLDDDGGWDE